MLVIPGEVQRANALNDRCAGRSVSLVFALVAHTLLGWGAGIKEYSCVSSSRRSQSKHSQKTGQYPRKGSGMLGRAESGGEDDRPFAEIRRTLHDALRLLSLHRWVFFVPFCIVSCAAFIGSLYYPRTYSATTAFEVRNDPVMSNLPLSAGVASYRYFRNTMVRDLTSPECMGEVVEKLGLINDAERNPDGTLVREWVRRRDSLARSLGADLNVASSSPSELIDIVKIAYTGPDPAIGKNLVDAVKHTYIRRTRAWIKDFLVSQRDYFLRESDEAGLEVTASGCPIHRAAMGGGAMIPCPGHR